MSKPTDASERALADYIEQRNDGELAASIRRHAFLAGRVSRDAAITAAEERGRRAGLEEVETLRDWCTASAEEAAEIQGLRDATAYRVVAKQLSYLATKLRQK